MNRVEPNPTTAFTPYQTIFTQLPRDVAIMRIAFTALATAYVVIKIGLAWSWPVAILGSAFALYTAHEHLIKKDPLVEAFYQIVGGKEKYNRLQVLPLTETDLNISDFLKQLPYDHGTHKKVFSQAVTSDGRKVFIFEQVFIDQIDRCTSSIIIAYVEKINALDVPRRIANMPEIVTSLFQAIPLAIYKNDIEIHDHSARRTMRVCGAISYSHATSFEKYFTTLDAYSRSLQACYTPP